MTRDVSLHNKNRAVQKNGLNGDNRTYTDLHDSGDQFINHDINRYNSSSSHQTHLFHLSSTTEHHGPCPKLNLAQVTSADLHGPCPKLNLTQATSAKHHGPCPKLNLSQATSTEQLGPCLKVNLVQPTSSEHHGPCPKLSLDQLTSAEHQGPCPKLNLTQAPSSDHRGPCPKFTLTQLTSFEQHRPYPKLDLTRGTSTDGHGPCPKLNLHQPPPSQHHGPCPKLNLYQPMQTEHHGHGPCPKLNLQTAPSTEHHGPCPKLKIQPTPEHHGPCPKLNLHQPTSEHHGPCPKLNLHQPTSEHHGPCPKLNLHQPTSEHHGPCPKLNLHQPTSEHHGPCPKLNLNPLATSEHHGPCPKLNLQHTNAEQHHGPCPKLNLNHSVLPMEHHSSYPFVGAVNTNYQMSTMYSSGIARYGNVAMGDPTHKQGTGANKLRETIHSGHFMVSDFEPESEVLDEEYEAGMPVPFVAEDNSGQSSYAVPTSGGNTSGSHYLGQMTVVDQKFDPADARLTNNGAVLQQANLPSIEGRTGQQHTQPPTIIDGSLTKLFQCMSLAYRQKLTSPKWNPFKGVRLRWKDKIRLNNVIWRCWHMQFILKQKAMVCQFASPLDTDQHNKPEAVVMEGKYWKRKLSTVAAEYKKWRLFYRNRIMGWTHHHPVPDLHPVSLDGFDWNRPGTFGNGPMSNIVFEDDLLMDFSDTLFSSLSSQPFMFPNPRELSRAGMVADFIQPGLVQLQPSLDDYMDTFEPFQDYINTKFLPAVPEQLEIDNLDLSQQDQMNMDLPNLIQSRMQQSQSSKQSGSGGSVMNQGNYHGQHDNSGQTPIFYSMTEMPGVKTCTTSSAGGSELNNSALSREHSSQQALKGSSGYTTLNYRDDMFAVPKGKPRGRSRSGNRNQPSTHAGFSLAPLTTNQLTSTNNVQMTASMNTSQTLLSHLLTTPGYGHYAAGSSGLDKTGSGSLTNQQQVIPQQSGLAMPGTLIDIQQHQQPWNPKNAKDTLNSTVSLNFTANSQVSSLTNINGGSAEGSPTRMSTTPSPPIGASGSGPPTPPKVFRGKDNTEKVIQEHRRRVCHINAEQKRRCNIKNGFDMLHSLIPQLSHNPNAKVSKAAMLQKGAEHIRQLKVERGKLKQEIEAHRQEVEALNSAINNCQSLLPATGAPVSRQRTNKMKEMFDQWVRMRTLENWKFWLFSILVRPLLDSFNNAVSTSSLDELCRTVLTWIDQHCSLVDLRPAVLNSLRFLCTTTDILTNPSNLPEEAVRAVNRRDSNNSETSGTGSLDLR